MKPTRNQLIEERMNEIEDEDEINLLITIIQKLGMTKENPQISFVLDETVLHNSTVKNTEIVIDGTPLFDPEFDGLAWPQHYGFRVFNKRTGKIMCLQMRETPELVTEAVDAIKRNTVAEGKEEKISLIKNEKAEETITIAALRNEDSFIYEAAIRALNFEQEQRQRLIDVTKQVDADIAANSDLIRVLKKQNKAAKVLGFNKTDPKQK